MKRSTAWILAAVAIAVLSIGVGRAVVKRQSAQQSLSTPAPAAVVTLAPGDISVVREADLQRTLAISGTLTAVNMAVVKAKVAAEVKQMRVREGDTVKAGQVIGQLDTTELSARLRQAQEQARAAQAQLDIAARTLTNNRALVDQGFISRNALDTADSSAAGARANVLAARAAVDLARKALTDATLRAPLSGAVSQRFVQVGERVSIDARLVEIVDAARLELEAAVAPEDVGRVQVGTAATLKVDGIEAPVRATVARINPATEAGTRAVMVYLRVEPQASLRHGLFGTGQIHLPGSRALVLPEDAVQREAGRPFVRVVEQGSIQRREITVTGSGVVDASPVMSLGQGVAAGTVVLRTAAGPLKDGTQVQVAQAEPATSAASNPPPAASGAASR